MTLRRRHPRIIGALLRIAGAIGRAFWATLGVILLALPALIAVLCYALAFVVGWAVAALVDGWRAGRGRA